VHSFITAQFINRNSLRLLAGNEPLHKIEPEIIMLPAGVWSFITVDYPMIGFVHKMNIFVGASERFQ
jgi:hypothetical protein